MRTAKRDLIDQIIEPEFASKALKYIGVVAGSLLGIFIIGYSFKILAHTVRGFNDLKNSLNGN